MVCPNINSKEWKDLVNAVGKNRAYSIFINSGHKIPSQDVIQYLTQAKVSEKELNWIQNRLPEGMDLSIFEILAQQTSYGNQYVWGQFKNNVLSVSALSQKGTGYHEYFHAIFRSYFSQEEVDAYLQQAANEIDSLLNKQNKSIQEYIRERNSTFIESGLTVQDKINLLYEEYLADNFAKFMTKRESNNIFQRIFQTLKDFIRFIFNNERELDLLFHKISNNDYRNQRIAMNKFQEGYLQDMAYIRKIYKEPIYDGEGNLNIRSFGVEESQQIIRDIAKIYFNLKNSDYYSKNKFNSNELLEEAINIMRSHAHDTGSDLVFTLDGSEDAYPISPDGDTELEYVRKTVKSFIKSVSPYFVFNEDISVDEEAADVDENGDPLGNGDDRENANPRDDSFGKESAEKQGWSRLPQFLREYISTSSYLELDANNNPILITEYPLPDGSTLPIYKEKTIDVNKIYFSLTRSLIDTPNDITRLVKMYEISRNNSNQKAFVDRFFKDSNLDMSKLDQMEAIQSYVSRRPDGSFTLKDITLIQAVLKGFDKYTQDPLMMAIDTDKGKTTVALANRNNASIIFYDHWQSNFESQMFTGETFNEELWKSVEKNLSTLGAALNPRTGFKSEQDVKDKARYVINELSKIGINLSQGFVEYSIIDNLKSVGKLGDSVEGRKLKNRVSRIALPRENVFREKTLIAIFKAINSQNNPFQVVDEGEGTNAVNQDASRTIMALAKGNVKFDEAAYETSYISSDGTMRYGHQDATLHLIEVNKMNNSGYLEKVLTTGIRDEEKGTTINGKFYKTDEEDADFRKNSLFNQPENGIRKLLDDGQPINFILRPADGIKEDALVTNDEGQSRKITFVKKGEATGVHFGDMTDRDFAVYSLNLVVENYETQDIVDIDGSTKERVFFSPVSLGMMETSKTHHYMYLPALRNVYNKEGLTESGINLLASEIEKEYNRIREVAKKIVVKDEDKVKYKTLAQLKADQKAGKLPFIFENYHTGKRRALDFSDFNSGFLTAPTISLLKEAAIDGKDMSEFLDAVKNDVANQFEAIVQQHLDHLENIGVVQKERGKYSSKLLSKNFFADSTEEVTEASKKIKLLNYTGMNNGFKANLAHVILQQTINSINALHIINGDPALMYKNDGAGTDFYKRMKTSNGAGISASHSHNYLDRPNGFKRTNMIVLKEPKVYSKFGATTTVDENGVEHSKPDEVDVADAQMYMRASALKHVLLGFGKLNENIADLIINKIEKGIPLSAQDLFDSGVVIEQDRFINPYKFIFRDPMSTKKISAFILTRNLVEVNIGTEENPEWVPAKDREELHDIYSLMEDKNIDFAVFETGSKTMTANVLDKGANGKYDRDSAFPISFSTEYLRLQLENPSNKTSITTPTQLIPAIDTEQQLDAKGYINGEEMPIGEVQNKFSKAVKDKHNVNYLVARNSMYTIDSLTRDLTESIRSGQIVPKLAEFQNQAIKGLLASGADSQLVDLFRTTLDEDGNEVPQFDLNNPKTIEKFYNLWYAHMSKGVYSLKNKGFAAALVSSHGFTPIKKIKSIDAEGRITWEVLRKGSAEYNRIHRNQDLVIEQITFADERSFKLNETNTLGTDGLSDLRERLKNGPVYFKDRLQYGVPRYENGVITGYFAEVLFPNHYPDVKDDGTRVPDALKYMFGNRIPLQDKHSMMNFEVVDFLPMEYGSSLVAPQEIVEFSGADYDIDKEYITVSPVYIENGIAAEYYLGDNIHTRFREYKKWMGKEVKEVSKRLNRDVNVEQALASLGLPATVEEYIKYTEENGELNNGVNERIIFESMVTLYSNQSMIDRGIPMAPANQEKLKALQFLEADPANPDSVHFKRGDKEIFGSKLKNPALTPLQLWRAKKANNVGKDNIGIIVNINKVFTVLNKADARIGADEFKIHYNGMSFDSFGNDLSQDGQRIIDYLSTLTSAATDEAKDSNCAKFGIGREELKAIGVLLSLGMPLADTILLVNQPIVKAYTGLLANEDNEIQTREEKDNYKTDKQKQEEAFDMIGAKDDGTKMIELDPKKLTDILFGEMDDSFSSQQSAALALFLQAIKLNETFSAVATVMKLTNGIDYNSIDNIKRAKRTLKLHNKNEPEVIEGLRYALTGDSKYIGNNNYINELASANLQNLEEIERLNNITFLTNTPMFQRVLRELNNVYNNPNTEERKQFEKDLLSYLILQTHKAFRYKDGNPNFRTGMIYDIPNQESIVDKFAKIKQKIATDPEYASLKNNALLAQLLAKSANPKIKGKNQPNRVLQIHELITRTTSKKNELQQGEMTLGFLELLEDPRTTDFAKELLDFELIKDGLQFQFQTIGHLFPVEMYNHLLGYENSAISFVRKFMTGSSKDQYEQLSNELDFSVFDTDNLDFTESLSTIREEFAKTVYGKNYTELINDFYKLKFTNAKSFKRLKKIKFEGALLNSRNDTPYRLNLRSRELEINMLSGLFGLKGQAAADKAKSNSNAVRKAGFFNRATDEIYFPRYFKSYMDIKGTKKEFLFEYQEDQRITYPIRKLNEEISMLESDYTLSPDLRITLKEDLDKQLAKYKEQLNNKALYKIVNAVGSPKVAPWLNPEGEVPVATAYREQARVLKKLEATDIVLETAEPKLESVIHTDLPEFIEDIETRQEVAKGPIETSLDQETKDILDINNNKLEYGSVDQIIKNNKC